MNNGRFDNEFNEFKKGRRYRNRNRDSYGIFNLVFSMIGLGLDIAFGVLDIVLSIFTGVSNSRTAESKRKSSQVPPMREEIRRPEPKTDMKQSRAANKEKVEKTVKQQKKEHTSDWNILLFMLTIIPVMVTLAAKQIDLTAYIAAAGLTVIIFYNIVRNSIIKSKQRKKQNEEIAEEIKKEDNELERVVKEAFDKVYAIRKELYKIQNQVIAAKIERLCDLSEKIIGEVRANPEALNSVRKFFYYYLDAFTEVFSKYLKLTNFSESSEEVQKLLADTEKSFDDMEEIFQEMCEGMLEKDMLNLKATINVLKNSNYTN